MHKVCGLIADEILTSAAKNHSLDNLSIVFIAFQNFKDYIESGRDLPPPQSENTNDPVVVDRRQPI